MTVPSSRAHIVIYRAAILVVVCFLAFASPTADGLPTPEQWAADLTGALPARPDRAAQYVEMLAERSPRVYAEIIGYTHQNRPLHLVTVTSPSRLAQFNAYRSSREGHDDAIRVLMMFAIHGDEISTVNAALLFLHALASPADDEIETALENVIVQIVPIANPDGYARSANWVVSHASAAVVTDPAHAEHQLGWPRGRFNHYGFDLNRQWLAASQPESRALLAAYRHFRPHIVGDFHEMLITWPYYFSPGVPSRRNPWLPENSFSMQQMFAEHLSHLFDQRRELYFSKTFFDEFSPAMGSTYPLLDGAIGLLLENRGFAGREIEVATGVETLKSRAARHRDVALEIIKQAASEAQSLRNHLQRTEEETTRLRGSAGDWGYLVIDRDGGSRLRLLEDMLTRHEVTVEQPRSILRIGGREVEPHESLFIPLDQPGYRLVRNLFEPLSEFTDPAFYDGPAWVLPPALNLQSYSFRLPQAQRQRVNPPDTLQAPTATDSYAYVFDWRHQHAPRVLARLLREGVQARLITGRFLFDTDIGLREYPTGLVVLPAGAGQRMPPAQLALMLAQIGGRDGVEIRTVTGGTSQNKRFLGDMYSTAARLPQVLLGWGPTVNSVEAGELWHLLDREAEVAVTLREPREFTDLALERYTHIVLPDGDYTAVGSALAERLALWVRAGGILVGVKRGALWAVDVGLTEAAHAASSSELDENPEIIRADYVDKEALEALDRTAGAILTADIDTSHPLGAGLASRELPLYRSGTLTLPNAADRFAAVVAWTDRPPIAGLLADSQRERLPGTPALLAERHGAGSVILFSDNPDHRGYWHGSQRLMFNVLYLGASFLAPGQRFAD